MMLALTWIWHLDGWIVAAGALCAAAAALPGNFLVLRRMSMLGDAISHAVLPGLAAAFLLTASRSSLPMFLGAVVAGVMTAMLTEWIRGAGRVDEGASMGVVFTALFALGLILIVRSASHVDLDPGCVLYGAIEATPYQTVALAGHEVPRSVLVLGCVAAVNLAFVLVFYKELKLASFDPSLATTTGFNARLMHYLLMVIVAVTSVASFETVGNILVVAMFIVPPATAHLLTDRLAVMIALSVALGVVAAIGGHIAALVVPRWFGFQSTNTAGMMAVVTGVLFLAGVLLAPRHGLGTRWVRRWLLSMRILGEDLLAQLYRIDEVQTAGSATFDALRAFLHAGRLRVGLAVARHRISGLIQTTPRGYQLTELGRQRARLLVRSHRLWEQYLVSEAGLASDRIHEKAERLEHFTDQKMRQSLDAKTVASATDPHGRPIPPEPPPSPAP